MAETVEAKTKETPAEGHTSIWVKLARSFVGILLLSAVTSLLLTLTMFRLTGKELATSTLTNGLALGFSPKGLDDPTQFANINESITEVNKTLNEMGFSINLKAADLKGLSPRDQRMKIFGQVADVIYAGDTSKLVNIPKNDMTAKIPIIGSDNPVNLVSASSHEKIHRKLGSMIVVTAVLGLIYIFLCRGFSRLSSPGWILLWASLPGFLIITVGPRLLMAHSFGSAEVNTKVKEISDSLLPPVIQSVSSIYYVAFGLAIGLIVVGTIGGLIMKSKQPATAKAQTS